MQIVRIGDGSGQHHSPAVVGAKAANLIRMAALGLPVPPGFVLPVKLCAAIVDGDAHAAQRLRDGLRDGIAFLEQATGKKFGDRRRPLLVSVRSGAERSMPGMLDTVLDVGCTNDAVHGLIRSTGRPRLAWDCRRRFLESYAETVLGVDPAAFAQALAQVTAAEGASSDRDLDCVAVEELARRELAIIEDCEDGFIEDAMAQLEAAARAVYRSWMSERAQTYRRLERLEHLQGTAVTVQAMVFGNAGLTSGAGVGFSRDPSTGARQPMVDMVLDGQGEDVVSGRRAPDSEQTIARALPHIAGELAEVMARLEHAFGDVQDIEFTVEDGKLWILQTRAAKRTPRAALRIATDLVHEGLISAEEALRRVDGIDLDALTETRFAGDRKPALAGTGASGGVAVGRAAFTTAAAQRLAAADPVILMRPETSTADVAGFALSAGIVTATGARTAHAALVARQMGKPCVVGAGGLVIDEAAGRARLGEGLALAEGDWVSIDGASGEIYPGQCEIVVSRPDAELAEVKRWRAISRSDAPALPVLTPSSSA
ncbi:MAG: PEP/pyruvate-binding domain-containing protein [Xanthobacteraceae bacterium]